MEVQSKEFELVLRFFEDSHISILINDKTIDLL